ncbi:MAG: ABC transporter permease subunit [Anaerolineales bacterium]|nr:ABC transporter permease subunit [Anaerolineales bacterium]
MKNIWTIAKREYNNYFNGPLAYIVALVLLFSVGAFFVYLTLESQGRAIYGGPPLEPNFLNVVFVFLMLFLAPAITMRLLSDEARMGTLELLLTAPVRDYELVVGKWLGSLLFVLSLVLFSLIYPIIYNNFVDPHIDYKLLLSSYIAVILIVSALLGLGVGISAMFSNQFAAYFIALGLFFILWFVINFPANFMSSGGELFNYLSVANHFTAINNGSFTLGDIVYFLSLTALGLFVGTTAIEIRRWR